MTEKSATAFAERLMNDPAFRERLLSAPNPAAGQAIVTDAGYDLSPGDLPALKAALGISDVSDDDLERIAGGVGEPGWSNDPITCCVTSAFTCFNPNGG